jgi:hypothetical protein
MRIKEIVRFFDKLEDKVRGKLSHYPILYALIGGVGVVLFWRGVWHTADDFNLGSIISAIIGVVVLLTTGVFVSSFIGNKIIISGLVGEKKLAKKEEGEIEKEEGEIETEETQIKNLQSTLTRLEKKLDHLDQDIEEKQ